MTRIIYLSVLVCTGILFYSCKNEVKQKDISNQEVSAIKGDSIFTLSGDYHVMDSVKKVYYLIRHAEKDTIPKDNPGLTEKGLKRATALADILRATRVDGIYSSFFTRTLFTVDSLADIKVISIKPYDHKNIRALVNEIESDDNLEAVVIVGHSNSTPALANTLSGKQLFNQTFDENDYNNFIIIYEKINGTKVALPLKYYTRE
ncbi:MAG: histidine phosphatase family protein [Saprospiraceae bacterium]|nr:histidine phosphatase family protein [Saprospiraceae bacterium]MBK7524332.1 histidine phosphatase family protein [Saprospiraceae bacterium]MBK8372748.1 histidine phosphatase family protein [Saprospiraceae bacterium]MBK8549126.1 histidine phosphatase family protein [Saprospiraceae bacterium]MBK8820911.1 histidine phosphatase family protein [Saprospiraceae bacterium]